MAPNYLIGFGERLVRPISIRTGGGPKHYPYSFDEARERLSPEWAAVSKDLTSLPTLACPSDQAVISVTLHPAFLARSYYPSHLLDHLGLRPVGSKPRTLSVLRNITHDDKPQIAPELFVAGDRQDIVSFARGLPDWRPSTPTQDDFRKIEEVRSLSQYRLRPISGDDKEPPLEVVLHARAENDDYVLKGFSAFLRHLGIRVNLDFRMHAGGLCFVPMRVPRDLLDKLMEFSFIRTVRRMPKLSLNESILRTTHIPGGFRVKLPDRDVVNKDVSAAIFVGGVRTNSPIMPWVRLRDAPGVGAPRRSYQDHGSAVISALLFGPIERDVKLATPYSYVDHWRVLDSDTHGHDFELMEVLRRVINVLRQRKYDLVCLSIGPCLPIEDDDVHVWTSTLDEYLSSSGSLLVSACGDTGGDDWESGTARIQPCSDGVNAIGVGAAGSRGNKWTRAPYSSVGPGRSPCFVKPDVVAFGGSEREPFWVLDPAKPGLSAARIGTSFPRRTADGVALAFGLILAGSFQAQPLKRLWFIIASPVGIVLVKLVGVEFQRN
jgi:Subtilase family